ncbi:hypothetical protein L7F22_021947 [Adiantum nelumboides]|nr:hypothetical protein [Adiantum nelumboides]
MVTSSSPQTEDGPPPGASELRVPLTSASSNLVERDTAAPSIVGNSTVSKPTLVLPRQASSIARQTSIYSLTLDEFQNTLAEPGKQFGSMNMDEFLKNIWTAEESQAMAVAMGAGNDEAPAHNWHHGIQRQGSVSLPRTLSKKTVEDVWKDIAGATMDMGLGSESGSAPGGGQERQVTFAEMTLEDFLMKAGVVIKENGHGGQSLVPFGSSFDNTYSSMPEGDDMEDKLGHNSAFFGYKALEDEKPNIKALPMLSLATVNLPSSHTGLGTDTTQMEALKHMSPLPRSLDWLTNNQFRSAAMNSHQLHSYAPQHMLESNANRGNGPMMGLGERNYIGPDLGVFGAAGLAPAGLTVKAGSPSSPLSDGVGPSHGSMSSISPLSYNLEGTMGGRKRGLDGSLEKVVERRQRRMIKNRESAARSRARKQAYTVELETEVLQLKEENMRLRLLQEEMADMRRKQFLDVLASLGSHVPPKARTLRRTQTGPW